MTNRAGCEIESRFLIRVGVQETRNVARGPQLRILGMTELAAIRKIDLVMAHQAIRHLRHICPAHSIGLFQPAMARHAGIPRI